MIIPEYCDRQKPRHLYQIFLANDAFRILLLCVFVLSNLGSVTNAADQDAAKLFAQYKNRIFQIRLIDLEADKKSGLGTGFLVAQKDLIATNFHVISEMINKPGKYRLEYLDEEGQKGRLTLLDVDVINDLALMRVDDLDLDPLKLPDATPVQGDTIYSLGNPFDIGFTVIPGTYNGLEENSYYKHIHFSGSINAGMSGGPVLDANGGVVGVNVSSAGNQVSFLVPADALSALIHEWRQHDTPITDFRQRISDELVANQRELLENVLDRDWPTQQIGEATTLGEMQPFVKCWGGSSDEKKLYKSISSACRSDQHIYLGPGFSTGVISYQFFWLEAEELGTTRFINYYQGLISNFIPDNIADEDDVGNYVCEEFFVADEVQHTDKAILCARAYKHYPSLYDALYLRGSVDESEKAFISHFTLAGVERETVAAFLERFQQVSRR